MPACERSPGPFRLRENICSGQDFSCQDIDHTVLSGCRFEGNGTDIDNRSGQPLDISQAVFQ